jgi:hypothetical protein
MSNDVKWFLTTTMLLIASTVVHMILITDARTDSYERGQIDAATGHQHYHLTTQPDSTTKWERKD